MEPHDPERPGRPTASPAGPTPQAPHPGDDFAASLRGFGLLGWLAILIVLAGNLVFVPLSALLALLWAWRSHTPWSAIGYVRPASWTRCIAGGCLLGAAFKLGMKAVVMPLLGAPAINQAYHSLAGNRAALPAALFAVVVGAGFGEETLFRGYLFERCGRLLGRNRLATAATVLLTSIWFGAVHFPVQGLPGTEQAAIVGLAFGTIYARTRRIFTLMVAHAAFDLTALALIYWNLESRVAHLVFH
jgi:uncharacterized protein